MAQGQLPANIGCVRVDFGTTDTGSNFGEMSVRRFCETHELRVSDRMAHVMDDYVLQGAPSHACDGGFGMERKMKAIASASFGCLESEQRRQQF